MKTPEEIKKGLEQCPRASFEGTCEGCPYDGEEGGCDDLLIDALAYIEQLETAQPKWISVEERMPESFVSVLVYMPESGPFPPVREAFKVGNVFYVPVLADRRHATHWLPMPEPPKEV